MAEKRATQGMDAGDMAEKGADSRGSEYPLVAAGIFAGNSGANIHEGK